MAAINDLRNSLDIDILPFNEAKILRIDFGVTLEVKKNVSEYFTSIRSRSKLPIDKFSNKTLQFRGTAKKIIFYDKVEELKKIGKCREITHKGVPISHDRWLRYEIQYKKVSALKKQLPRLRMLVHLFDDFSFYLDGLLKEFHIIQFSLQSDLTLISQPGNSSDVFACALIIALNGENNAIQMINDLKENDKIRASNARYCIQKLKGNASNFKPSDFQLKNELLADIEDKLAEAYIWYNVHFKSQVDSETRSHSNRRSFDEPELMPSDLGLNLELDPDRALPPHQE